MIIDEETSDPTFSCLSEDQLRELTDPALLEFLHAETIAPAPSKKAIWIEQWVRWNAAAASERRSRSLTPAEIGGLEPLPRLLSQKYSMLDNFVSLMRQDPEADSVGAVLVLVTLLADNDRGRSTLAVDRMAKLLRRNERRVRESLKRLVAMGLVRVEHRPGKPTSYTPVINPDFADINPSIVWFVDAYSDPPSPAGRPAKSHNATVRPFQVKPRTDEAGVNERRTELSGRMCPRPRTEQSTNTSTDTTFPTSSKNTRMEPYDAALGPVMQGEVIFPSEMPPEAVERLSNLRSSWKDNRSSAIEGEETVRLLRRQLAAVGLFIRESLSSGGFVINDTAVQSILMVALDQTIGTCEGARLSFTKGGNFESYFAASFRAKAAAAAKEFVAIDGQARIAAAKVRIEQQAGEKKLGALARKIDATQHSMQGPNESERDRMRRMMRAAAAEERGKSLQGRALNEALAAGGSEHVVTHFLEPLLNSDLPWSKEKVAAWCVELSKSPETNAASVEMLEWAVQSLKKRGTWLPVSGIIRSAFETLVSIERLRANFETIIHETNAAWAEAKSTDPNALEDLGKPKLTLYGQINPADLTTEDDCFRKWLGRREVHLKPRDVSYTQATADIGKLNWRHQTITWGDPPPSFAARMTKQARYPR